MNEWWTNSSNVLSLANALVAESLIDSCRDLLYYFEKPSKWAMEWDYFMAHRTLEGFEGEVRTR